MNFLKKFTKLTIQTPLNFIKRFKASKVYAKKFSKKGQKKLKVKQAVMQRFKITGSGRVFFKKTHKRHHAWAKSSPKLRALSGYQEVTGKIRKNLLSLIRS
jgi:ribosomal protein L35